MTLATLTLLLPLATANPPKWNMAPTPGCATCAPGGMPMVPGMMPGAMMPGSGYPPFPQPCPPTAPPAPVLFAKIIVPNGAIVTAHPGSSMAKSYTGTQTFGFRPGYRYRLQMTGKANAPLYPVVSVYGSLVPRNGLNYWEFPAPITFSELDLARAALGAQVTKVIYLEDPKKAVPFASKPDEPLEFNEDSPEIARQAAHDSGRVVAIVTIGDRVPDAAELTANAIANTILLPGETALAAPAAAPPLVWSAVPLYDPIIGPKPPVEECITDGGDKGDRLGFNNAGKIGGLNATDVGVEYTVDGKRKITTSNEVCICSPRFAIKKAAIVSSGMRGLELLDFHTQSVGRLGMQTRLKTSGVDERVKPIINDSKIRPMITAQQEGVHVFVGAVKAHVVYVYEGTHQIVSSIGPDEKTSSPNRLVVTKSVTPNQAVQIGDTVTFTIKYENRTPHPISDLVVSDSLSGRLEFVPGSAASDRTTNVTTTANEAGSVTVRFELPGTLAPGDTGTVQFKAKVR